MLAPDDTRAQASTLGVLFATLLVLVSVTTLSVAALGPLDVEDQTFVGIDAEVTTDAVVVTSEGGEVVPASDLALLVGTDPVRRYGVETLTNGERFEPGDRARLDLSPAEAFGNLLAVRVVHEPSERTLFGDRVVVRRVTPVPVGLGRPVGAGTPTSTPTTTDAATPTGTPAETPTSTPTARPASESDEPTLDSVSTNDYKSGNTDFVSATVSISGADGDERVGFELRDRDGTVLDTDEDLDTADGNVAESLSVSKRDRDDRYTLVVRLLEGGQVVDTRTVALDGP